MQNAWVLRGWISTRLGRMDERLSNEFDFSVSSLFDNGVSRPKSYSNANDINPSWLSEIYFWFSYFIPLNVNSLPKKCQPLYGSPIFNDLAYFDQQILKWAVINWIWSISYYQLWIFYAYYYPHSRYFRTNNRCYLLDVTFSLYIKIL